MADYRSAYEGFDLEVAHRVLGVGPDGRVNAAAICCDRWCGNDRAALYWAGGDGARTTYSFEQLRALSSRFAHVLVDAGVKPGDRVAGLLPRTPELLATIIAVWRIGAVYQPLFTAFGPKAIEHRVVTSGAKIIVTDAANRSKLSSLDEQAMIALIAHGAGGKPTDILLPDATVDEVDEFPPVPRTLDDPFLIMFTSGTTGPAKPLLVPLRAIAAFVGYMRDSVDLRAEDRFWNIADPGWAYGLYYAVTAPLALGHATLFYSGGFTAQDTVRLIREFAITNLAGSPTAFRQLVTADPAITATIKGQLRAVSSAGEPLNPDTIAWFAHHLGVPIHDHYGQTELGMVVCNHHALSHPVAPGSAGFASPGHRVAVVDEAGTELAPGVPGILAVDRERSPLFWFSGYENAAPLEGRYYLSGDTVEAGDDGSISFVGRADDVITSSGYRIGPFDVESALVEHSAVAEAAVIGKPDPERTEIVKAFIVLRSKAAASDALAAELQQHVKRRLSAHAYPREIAFVDALPKTPSGKVQRFLLRAEERQRAAAGG